jgi:FeS assembly SUF system protein
MRRFVDLLRSRKSASDPNPPAPSPEAPAAPVRSEPPSEAAAPENPGPEGSAADARSIEDRVLDVLRDTFDPEIPVNIYELGLIYEIRVDGSGAVRIRMTLTSPACPVAGSLPPEVESRVRAIPGVTDVAVDLVWDPPWNPSMMSEAAKLQLGML